MENSSSSSNSSAPLAWHDFLDRMRHPSASDFVKSIKSYTQLKVVLVDVKLSFRDAHRNRKSFDVSGDSFIVSVSNKAPDPEKDSAAVQEFLAKMEGAFRAHMLWAGCSEEELESAGEGLEKYVMTKLFNRVFASLPEDVLSDEELFEKISLLQQFIRPENLDIKPAFQNETSWLLAQKELQKINLYKAPRDKLICILNCCKVINNLLLNVSVASHEDPPGADDFLPVLIYVTIKANPPQLHSNLLYIQRYRSQSRLVSEVSYYFTNFLSVESFIWNVDASSLSMDEEEFQKKMESARVHILGLSTNRESQRNQTNQERNGQIVDSFRNPGTHTITREYSDPPQMHEGSNDLEQDQPTTAESSISRLEEQGAVELLKDDQCSKYFQEFPYFYANAGDLTVDDVHRLLDSYKRLVLMYVTRSRGRTEGSSNTNTESDDGR